MAKSLDIKDRPLLHRRHQLNLYQCVVYVQCLIQRVRSLGFPTPKLKFPPSSFADFCYILVLLSHP